jgi:hypothetical protein
VTQDDTRYAIVPLLAALAVAGCSSSHGRGDDAGALERCGSATCAAGTVCCNASCGICARPGEGCILLECVDAGPPPRCGASVCGAGETCCPGCPGSGPFCASGPSCPDVTCPPPRCEGLSYCDCAAFSECAPLIDLTPGCICPCDDPFNCTGELCDCACGGAQYRGCTEVGRCPETEVHCSDPGASAIRGADGCLICVRPA